MRIGNTDQCVGMLHAVPGLTKKCQRLLKECERGLRITAKFGDDAEARLALGDQVRAPGPARRSPTCSK